MEFKSIAASLGITAYPEAFDKIYSELSSDVNISDIGFIEEAEKKYSIFREHYDAVIAGAKALANDKNRLAYGNVVSVYNKTCSVAESRRVPIPASDGTPAGDMLPMLILLRQIPASVESYKQRGFTDEQALSYAGGYRSCMNAVKLRVGRLGLNKMYYDWCCLYAKCSIFNYGIFNMEIRQFPENAMALKNRNTGEGIVLMRKGRFDKKGYRLGSAGHTDEQGAFDADFSENENEYIGRCTVNGLVSDKIESYSKKDWEVLVLPGEDVMSIHIPKGADFTPEKIEESFRNGLVMARERFPEFSVKCIFCSSWLLDPTLVDILGEKSKIVCFGNRYVRFPNMSAGYEVFNFVFPGKFPKELDSLPENTSLERGLKKLYLDGGFVHAYSGVVVE